MTTALSPAQRTATSRIAALTIVNAMVFQEMLALHDGQIKPLNKTLDSTDPLSEFSNHWQFIIEEIDYVPIFSVARQLLLALPANFDVDHAIRFLVQQALTIVRSRAALRHDLMGRVYHRLLTEAKFLGTYYTSVPAATLLLKVALSPEQWQLDWADTDALASFRIADLACGTGTLLMAAAEAVSDNYASARSERGLAPDLRELHRLLLEQIIYGYDVLPSALHLTASTLALRSSDVAFELTNLRSLPLGGRGHRLGSIEFLKSRQIHGSRDLFGPSATARQVTGSGDVSEETASLPDLDLCVMNPPFTRSVGGNLLFGSLPEAERRPMQRDLRQLLQRDHILASGTAGLGSVFVAAGDRALKEGGRMALVLPKALLSGVAWGETRELVRRRYTLEYLIVSHDPTRWNFSDNTDLSEVLVVARKTTGAQAPPSRGGDDRVVPTEDHPVVCLNLWRNPSTAVEALNIGYTLMQHDPSDVATGQGAGEVSVGGKKAGEVLSMPWSYMQQNLWMLPCAFAQSELVRAAYQVLQGRLYVPGYQPQGTIPLSALSNLGTLGPDRRDIADGFNLGTEETAYPAFWGHDAPLVTTLAKTPKSLSIPTIKPENRGHTRAAETSACQESGSSVAKSGQSSPC